MWLIYPVLVLLSAAPQAALTKLSIVKVTLHQFEDGPPIYADQQFIPGETVFLSFQVVGYDVAKSGEERSVHLSYQLDAMDSEGIRLVKTNNGEIKTSLSPQDKDWLPKVRWHFVIPPHALPGTYRIEASVKDELNMQEASTETTFVVRGRHVELSDTLTVRNFAFLRGEEDTHALSPAVYRPGQRLWARFDITGFKIGEKNHVQVDYGISILNAEDKVLFTQPEGAEEEDSPFYPKRYVPGAVSLNIQPKTAPGQYILLLTVHDKVGGQTDESRHPFAVSGN